MGKRLFLLYLAILLPVFSSATSAGIFESLVMPGPVIQAHEEYETNCAKCHQSFKKQAQAPLCLDCHEETALDVQNGRGFHGREENIKGQDCKHCHTEHQGREVDIVVLDRDAFDHRYTDFPLVGAHQKAGCSGCHKEKNKFREAPSRCENCHGENEPHRGKLGKECGDCHTEKSWSDSRFDHGKTKFALLGKHEEVACKQCHPDARYKLPSTQCQACHGIHDVHTGRFGKRCDKCHEEKGWREIRFDHDKETDFKLLGAHQKLQCKACHKNDNYEQEMARECYACHKNDDEHRERNGRKCEKCHREESWSRVSFDHGRDTDFVLQGKHRQLSCEACHRGKLFRDDTPGKRCNGCHQRDDIHVGALGKSCVGCHQEENWKQVRFEHDKDTEFPLSGGHTGLACHACHRKGTEPEKMDGTCFSCHEKDDVHEGQQGKECGRCHGDKNWGERIRFEHDITRFPLIGLHASAPCEACHLSSRFKDTEMDCVACHQPEDVHEGTLGTRCAVCHNPNGWQYWEFDHDKQTEFPLQGAHEELGCTACHKERTEGEIVMSTECVACHQGDDEHRGGFGRRCERCHVNESFSVIRVR